MKAKYLLFIFLQFIANSCNKFSSTKSDVYSINVSECNSNFQMTAIFDKIAIIPLESQGVPLVGQMEIYQYTKDFVYILDKKKESVFIFSTNGRFVREIHKKGKGPGEYSDIKFFEFNPFEGTIDIMSKTGSLFRYTPEGIFIEYFSTPEGLRAASFFTNLNKDTIVFYTNSEQDRLTFFSKSRNSVISRKHNLPVYEVGSSLSPFYKYKGNTYLYEGFENHRYLIDNVNTELHYSIEFCENNFTTKDIPEYGTKKLFNDALQSELDKPFFWSNIENENYIITTYRLKSDNCTIIINKQTKKIISLKSFMNGCNFPFGSSFERNNLVNVVPAYIMPYFINEKLKSEFGLSINKRINEYSNPLIIIYKLKDNL